MTLHISQNLVDQLTHAARSSHPIECCGLLLGHRADCGTCVTQVMPSDNIADSDRRRSFQVDSSSLLAAIRATRRGPEEIVGFYHSHPDGSPHPSSRDVASAWRGRAYAIIAPHDDRRALLTSWRMRRGANRFEQESVVVQ